MRTDDSTTRRPWLTTRTGPLRHPARRLAITIVIVVELVAWRDRYTPDCRPHR